MTAPDNSRVRLIVFFEPKDEALIRQGKFCGEVESSADVIRQFCKQTHALTYPEHYVSAAVIRADEDIRSSGARIYAESRNSLAVRYAVLRDTVLPNVCAVGNDDLLQLMTKIAKAWRDKTQNWRFLMRDIRNLIGESTPTKEEMLLWATRNRGNRDYSEARLNRCIGEDDVHKWGDCGPEVLA